MTRLLVILLLALVVEAVGVVLLSRGLKEIGPVQQLHPAEILRLLRSGATNGNILAGVALEALFFAALLYLLSQRDVSLVWPLTSLGFVITAIAARFILGEQISWIRWAGVMLIVLGAALVSASEAVRRVPAGTGEGQPVLVTTPK